MMSLPTKQHRGRRNFPCHVPIPPTHCQLASKSVSEPDLNRKVYAWAHSRLGQHVGGGECWDLADGALRASGAASSTTTGKHDDYVCGDSIQLHQVVAGDILQLRNHARCLSRQPR